MSASHPIADVRDVGFRPVADISASAIRQKAKAAVRRRLGYALDSDPIADGRGGGNAPTRESSNTSLRKEAMGLQKRRSMPLTQIVSRLRAWISRVGVAFALSFATVAAQAAPIDDAEKIEVRIPSGDAVLAATLYLPAGARGNLPAVVLGHGSGRVTRQNSSWANIALSMGLAALIYDKRGVGDSTGVFVEFEVERSAETFQQLASDMVNATRWLSTQPRIDRARIGLMGGSQAGWIMPLAASQEPLIRFLIIGEGVPLPVGIEHVHGGYLDLLSSEDNPTLRQVTGADAAAMDYEGPMGYDPRPVLERLNIPTLWVFGLYDGVIPVRQSIDRIGQLHRAGKRNHHIQILPFANHEFYNVFTGATYDFAEISREWLRTTSGLFDAEYLADLRRLSQSSDEQTRTRIEWTIRAVEARLNPPRLSAASLRALSGRYHGGRLVIAREGKLFLRRADGLEREMIPLDDDLFALGEYTSSTIMRIDRSDNVVTGATFLSPTGPYAQMTREGQ